MIEVPSRSRTSHAPGRNIQSSSSSMSVEMTGLSSTRSTVFVHGLGFSSKAVPRLYRISSHPVEHGDEYSGVRIKNNIET
ncbi:hypothetical protein BKA82DRAFT_1002530 [Pisolithus tinctorius]|uniref:Uncharacterized protein n=1 Tax=Pisolithus tinctorius Marx 270 TaxID=870435 RepID=A0A0C3NMH3_PISTI|nr:hypothetical protein BKA82DRAFT_1002530 [Pisolithus tinctorius]KIO02100.1 hypothetical protein M404DRAFT_1002530 [Pisolithus tinctorius Marx 270]